MGINNIPELPEGVLDVASSQPQSSSAAESYDNLPDVDVELLNLSTKMRKLIVNGDEKGKYVSRSEAVYAGIMALVYAGCSDQQILSVLTDSDNAISECALSRGNGSRQKAVQWLFPQLTKARSEIASRNVTNRSQKLNEYVYIVTDKRFVNIENGRKYDTEQFNNKLQYAFEKISPANYFLNSFPDRIIDNTVYKPNKPVLFERKGEKYYNHWRGSDIIPAEGDVSIMLNHIQYLSPEYADIILDYLAYNVQFSGQKIHWALLIQGKQGTGKSAIGLMMSKILGEHNVVSPDNEKIHEKYTEWQINKLLVVIEELMAKNRVQLINKLKPMITQGVTDVREMYTPSYEIENCYNFLIFTNHRDAIFLEKDDRRYCIIFSDAEPKDKAYYNQLFDFIEKKAGFFLYYLQKRDLSGFNPKGHAPMTAAKQFLLEDSLHPIEKAINALTESNTFPFNGRVAPTQEAATAISNFLNDKTIKGQALSKHLCSAGYQRKDKQRLEDKGNPVNFWLKSGAEMTLDAIKQEYQRQKDIFGSDDF